MLEGHAHLFAPQLRGLWPLAAEIAAEVNGRLMGGTALAVHLKHRTSEDLDIMTMDGFDGRELRASIEKRLRQTRPDDCWRAVEIIEARNDSYCAVIDGIRVEVFTALGSGSAKSSDMRWAQAAQVVEGTPVGTVPDILASKLAVIERRQKLRDYIDLAAIDRSTPWKLEDGLDFYRRVHGFDVNPDPHQMRRIVTALSAPGYIEPDPGFDSQRDNTLEYLEHRSGELLDYMAEIADRDVARAAEKHASGLGASRASASSSQCGAWMPRARTTCRLPPDHKGPHRRRRR